MWDFDPEATTGCPGLLRSSCALLLLAIILLYMVYFMQNDIMQQAPAAPKSTLELSSNIFKSSIAPFFLYIYIFFLLLRSLTLGTLF